MTRPHFVKKARQDNPVAKKGESYWWWKFRHGSKHFSKERPANSQLTQSEFWSQVYELQERAGPPDYENCESEIDDIKNHLEMLRDECQGKRDSQPDNLQDGPVAQQMEERVEALENAINELESIDTTIEYGDAEEEETSDEEDDRRVRIEDDRAAEIWDEVKAALESISCS